MNKVYGLFFIISFSLFPPLVSAQQDISPEQIEEYKANVQNLVEFLEYSFNTLGDRATSARDKDVIINQSYAKIFRDANVQVEDDLDENREILINKDVQAYLKDIDFFFKRVEFKLNVSSIEHHFTGENELYFVVSLTRSLNGRSITGDTVSSVKERFIELNFDEDAQDLRIVSIYTTKIDERDELFAWWNNMPESWRKVLGSDAVISDTTRLANVIEINDTIAIAHYFGERIIPIDTFLAYGQDTMHIETADTVAGLILDTIALPKNVSYRMLQRLASETEIDISGNLSIRTLEPLAQMGKITKVNCSNTLIDDLSPLRHLIHIESLECSGTPVTSIAPLQYSVSLTSLDIHTTRIIDMELLANLRKLERLNFSNTPTDSLDMLSGMVNMRDLRFSNTFVSQLSPLKNMKELQILNCSYTYIEHLGPVNKLNNLERLYISNTPVADLEPLNGLEKLQTIYLDSTNVSDIEPLTGLPELESIYCDNTGINGTRADRFMAENPKVLVIYESVALSRWWNNMPAEWKNVFRGLTALDPEPTKEQLHKAIKITSLDISGNQNISELGPVKMLVNLSAFDCSSTRVENLWPLSDLIDLNRLNCSNTSVENCEPLRDLTKLEHLDLSYTGINDLQCISRIRGLKELSIQGTGVLIINVFGKSSLDLVLADGSKVGMAEVIAFKGENPETTIVYQSGELQDWWAALPQPWKTVFSQAIGLKNGPDITDLQKIADIREIDISQNMEVGGLLPLNMLYMLQTLKMNDTHISDLSPLSSISTLKELNISNNPISGLEDIAELIKLEKLEFRNTQVSDLRPLAGLIDLRVLDMSGTEVKKLTEIEVLTRLEEISFYNTSIKSLSPLEGMPDLKNIKCYNTKLRAKKVENFRTDRPGLEIIFY